MIRFFLVLPLMLLASCGFEPMYGEAASQSPHSVLQGNLLIAPIPAGRMGQILKIALEDKFNPEGITFSRPDYELSVNLRKTLIPSVVKSDGTIQRYEVQIDSTFTLTKTGETVKTAKPGDIFKGKSRRSGSYNVPDAHFATYTAENDITERLLQDMAEDFLVRINAHFAGKN